MLFARLLTLQACGAALSLLPALAGADRITQMPAAERCAYKAKLSAAGYYYFLQGRQRHEIALRWHGDETAGERQFVEHTLDEVYEAAAAERREQPERAVSEQSFGDRVYQTCMAGSRK